MAEVYTQTVPNSSNVTQTVQAKEAAPKEDLVTRASKVSLDNPQKADGDNKPSTEESKKFDVKDIDKIADPVAKKLAEEAYKSFQADYTRKTQELSQQRKEVEEIKQKLANKSYTIDDIPKLINDPSFIQAATEYQRINGGQRVQSVDGDLTQEEFSYLTPEQQKLYTKTKEVEQTNQAILSKLSASETARVFQEQDMTLKSKYANYEPAKVDEIYQGMMKGTIQATREHLWKVQDYDEAVKRAYELGRQDRKTEMGEKLNASSTTNGVSVTQSDDVPTRLANESGPEYFKRIALSNAAKFLRNGK